MGLPPLLLLFLLGGAVSKTINACGRDVSTMKNYLNKPFDIPLHKVADVLLAPVPFQIRYFAYLQNTKFEFFSSSYSNLSVSNWASSENFWLSRNVSYLRKFKGNHFYSSSNTFEQQKTLYQERSLVLLKHVRTGDLDGISITVEYCVTPGTVHYTDLEVHINMTISSVIGSIFKSTIQESAHKGFLETYGALNKVLSELEKRHTFDDYESDVSPVEINYVLHDEVITTTQNSIPIPATRTTPPQMMTIDFESFPSQFTLYFFIVALIGLTILLAIIAYCHNKEMNNQPIMHTRTITPFSGRIVDPIVPEPPEYIEELDNIHLPVIPEEKELIDE